MFIEQFLFEIECQNTLGENVLWHAHEQTLYWTDIQEKRLFRWHSHSGDVSDTQLPFRLCSFAFTPNPNVLLAAFDKGIAEYNIESGELNWISLPESDNENTRFNDGKCDPVGRFWVGSMLEQGKVNKLKPEDLGALYCLTWPSVETGSVDTSNVETSNAETRTSPVQANVKQVFSGIQISNGLAFNESGSRMFHTDSPKHKIDEYTLNSSGEIVAKKRFAKFPKHCYPDGATVDKNGKLWTVLWGGAYLTCIDDDGSTLLDYPLPVSQPTCLCIGGPNMDWLFVTSAKEGLSAQQLAKQPSAGNLLVYQLTEALGRDEALVNMPLSL